MDIVSPSLKKIDVEQILVTLHVGRCKTHRSDHFWNKIIYDPMMCGVPFFYKLGFVVGG